jgi:hypothetical protein
MNAIVARRWCAEFRNAATGETRVISVGLDKSEQAAARAAPDPSLMAATLALRRAYRVAPKDFLHVNRGVTPAWN